MRLTSAVIRGERAVVAGTVRRALGVVSGLARGGPVRDTAVEGTQEETRIAALRHARHAIAAGGDDAAALATAGFVIAVAGRDFETALTAFDRSFALSSSSALALGFSSIVRAWKGDDVIAVEHGNRALRLSPFDPLIYLPYGGLAYAHFAAGRFGEAVTAASLAAQSNPRFIVLHMLHAASLARRSRRAGRSATPACHWARSASGRRGAGSRWCSRIRTPRSTRA